jgi:biopolymer transport protein ExbD
MAMQLQDPSTEDEVNSAINVVPLTDIMLVLMIIFLITVPVVLKAVPLNLPLASNIPTQTKPENIVIAIDKEGNYFFNNQLVTNTELLQRLERAAVIKPQPEVHIRADREVRFQVVGQAIYDCQRASILKVGFITEPDRPAGQ